MSGTLALVGGGEWSTGCSFDRGLVERSGTSTVLVVPTAAAYERPEEVVARASTWFADLGATVEVLEVYRRAQAVIDAAAAPLVDASFVYLAGGSPMHLRSVLKSTPVWDGIVGVLRRGGVVAASAEAAAVMSTHMVDSRGGAFTVGLDLLPTMTVIGRYNLWSEDKLHRTLRLAPAAMSVVGIDEATALIWDSATHTWSVEGTGSVVVYRDGHRVGVEDLDPPFQNGEPG